MYTYKSLCASCVRFGHFHVMFDKDIRMTRQTCIVYGPYHNDIMHSVTESFPVCVNFTVCMKIQKLAKMCTILTYLWDAWLKKSYDTSKDTYPTDFMIIIPCILSLGMPSLCDFHSFYNNSKFATNAHYGVIFMWCWAGKIVCHIKRYIAYGLLHNNNMHSLTWNGPVCVMFTISICIQKLSNMRTICHFHVMFGWRMNMSRQ